MTVAKPPLTFARVAAADLRRRLRPVSAPEAHRHAALDWLVRAQDATPDGGVSYGYSVKGGWRPSYVETTGYIATTFFDQARLPGSAGGRPELRERALRMIAWLLSVQRGDGSFTNERFARSSGIVFDTGQVLLGLTRAVSEVEEPEAAVLRSAVAQASRWLVEQAADETGRWTRHTHLGVPHVYNTRVAWALLLAHQDRPNGDSERVARSNLDWAVSQERAGWFESCAFQPGVAPFTHTIAYAIRGLWESGLLLSEPRYLDVARRAADAVAGLLGDDGFLPGQIDVAGRPAARYCCLTGNCQMAIIWARLHAETGSERYRAAASRALRYVAATQDLSTPDECIRGAVKGSQPVWGRYAPLSYPNWATKFFVDALTLCGECAEWDEGAERDGGAG